MISVNKAQDSVVDKKKSSSVLHSNKYNFVFKLPDFNSEDRRTEMRSRFPQTIPADSMQSVLNTKTR